MSTIQDTDLLLVNRGGVDYKITASDLKFYLDPKLPWEDYLDPILHLKNASQLVTFNGGDTIEGYDMSGNLVRTRGEIYPGEELVFLCKTDFNKYFFSEEGTWDFGELTNTSSVTDMSEMFYSAKNFNSDTIALFDTSNVENMKGMFKQAAKFNSDISGWDVSKCTDMSIMFDEANEFNQFINNWDVSSVTTMSSMFNNAWVYNQPLDNWDLTSCENIHHMFWYCNNFNQNISAWNTSNITDMEGALYGCWQFVQDLSEWCVDPEPLKRQFAKGSGIEKTPDKQPQWGTCPRGEN